MQKFLSRFWPIIFLLGIWFLFSHPFFLKGAVPYSSAYQVNFFAPWSHFEQFWGPVKNNAMPDVHTQIFPWKKFTIDTYKAGQIPLWNPYSFSGNPHLANFQSAVLSPFNLLFFILPFIDAWSILILLQPLFAALFMYLFVREIGVSRIGSVISSVTFMFCGFIVVWMSYGTLTYAIVYLPLALFAIEKYFSTKRLVFLFLLTATIPLSFFSGHFQISFYFLLGIAVYILFKVITTKNIYNTVSIALATLIGLLLSIPQLIPSIQLYLNSVRSELFLITEAIPAQYLITSIAPDFFGNPVTRNDWFGHYAEWASFIGIWPFVLAIYAIINKRIPHVLLFSVIAMASLILATLTPLSPFLVSLKLPVLSTSAFSRIIVLASFSFAILAGFGLDKFSQDIIHKKQNLRNSVMFILGIMTVFVGVIWLTILIGKVYPPDWLIVAKRNFVVPTALFIAGASAIFLVSRSKNLGFLIPYLLLLLVSFDSLRFAQKWMPFDPKNLVNPEIPVIEGMKKNIEDGRVFGNIGAEVTTYYHLPSVEGYDPLYIGRYGEFIRGASNGDFLLAERSVVRLDRKGKYTDRVLDLLGTTLIFHPIADTNQGWAYPVWEDSKRYSIVYQDDRFQLFKNNDAFPRASIFYDYEVISGDEAMIKRFYNNDFDYRKKLILEENIGEFSKEGLGSARIVSYSPNKVSIEVETTRKGLLFIADNYYPSWKVTVNNKEEKIYRADYTFRAVVVPEGKSKVVFIYEDILK